MYPFHSPSPLVSSPSGVVWSMPLVKMYVLVCPSERHMVKIILTSIAFIGPEPSNRPNGWWAVSVPWQ